MAATAERSASMVVAVDSTPLLGPRTGIGEFCAGAIGALAVRSDVSVNSFAVSWSGRQALAPQLPRGVANAQRAMPARPLHALWRLAEWPKAELFVGRCDVVHGTNFVVPPTRRAARVVTVHDLTPLRFPEMCDKASLSFPSLVRRAVAGGAWVHTPSVYVAEEVAAELAVPAERVRAVAHGIPHLPPSTVGIGALPGWISWPTGIDRYVLAVGTIEPRKDYPALVAAFTEMASYFPDVALVIAGRSGWGSEALEQVIASSAMRHRIVRPGYVDAQGLADLMGAAAVLAYPSRYEGFGFPPLQAMAVGTPVVATAAGAVPEVVGDAARLVTPGDVPAMAAALGDVLGDPSVSHSLSAAGKAQAQLFSWEETARGLMSIYRDALDARDGRHGAAARS